MAKSKRSKQKKATTFESDTSPLLEVSHSEPLFSVAAHPTKPILVTGLATGHVHCNTYNAEALEEEHQALADRRIDKSDDRSIRSESKKINNRRWTYVEDHDNLSEKFHIVSNWKTKRHKGSCRSVIFDPLVDSVGENIYSVGTDHVIKKANTETGKVIAKTKITQDRKMDNDAVTKMIHSPTHPFLLTGLESGDVLVYDSKNLNSNPLKFTVSKAHADAINHLCPMPAVSAYHYLSLGSTTLSHIDIRKGVITESEDQGDELLTMCFPNDYMNGNQNDTLLVSHGEGIVTLWKKSKNDFTDQISRIKINKNTSIDAMIPTMNVQNDDELKSVWCGDSEGLLHRFNYASGKVVERRVHSDLTQKNGAIDEVGMLEIDYNYRLISAGMDSLKIWPESSKDDSELSDMDDSSDESSDSESESDLQSDSSSISGHNLDEEDEEDIDAEASGISDSEPVDGDDVSNPKDLDDPTNHSKYVLEEPPKKKTKTIKKESSQKRSVQRQEHGIKRFDGL